MDPSGFLASAELGMRARQDALCHAAGVKVPADAEPVTREAFTLAAQWRLLANRMAAL